MPAPSASPPEVFALIDRFRHEYARRRGEHLYPLLDECQRARQVDGHDVLDFIRLDGEEFVRAAYREILRSEPESTDIEQYLASIEQGRLTKTDVLRRLRRSDQGRRVALHVWGLAGVADGETPALAIQRIPESSAHFEERSSYALTDFLLFHDAEFVRNAYRGVLRRAPDPDGFEHFLSLLRSGALSKVELLGRLRYSTEGRSAAVRIKGLLVPLAVRTTRRLPIIGRLLAILQYVGRLPELARSTERLERELMRAHFDIARNLNAAYDKVEAYLPVLDKRIADTAYSVERCVVSLSQSLVERQRELASLASRLETIARDGARHSENVECLRSQLHAFETRSTAEQGRQERAFDLLSNRTEELAQDHQIDELRALVVAHRRDLEMLTNHVRVRDERFEGMLGPGLAFGGESLDKIHKDVISLRRNVVDQERRIAQLLEAASISVPPAQHLRRTSAEGATNDLPDSLYASIEERFRGAEEEIRSRSMAYLPFVTGVGAGTPDRPVLDVGCGRGEWLAVLRDSGLIASGVDMNQALVDQCLGRGLNVVTGDAIEFLRSRPANSLGAITAMHVIEHLPFRRFIFLLDEAFRTLQPGGVAIFETPNPENVLVGACTFYYDPTHQRPLPPEPTRFIAELRGFDRVETVRLHPYEMQLDASTGDGLARSTINEVLYGPRDYALVAYKSALPADGGTGR